MPSLFELNCKSYELRQRYLKQLKSYQGTDEAFFDDDEKIYKATIDALLYGFKMIHKYGDKAKRYFESLRESI